VGGGAGACDGAARIAQISGKIGHQAHRRRSGAGALGLRLPGFRSKATTATNRLCRRAQRVLGGCTFQSGCEKTRATPKATGSQARQMQREHELGGGGGWGGGGGGAGGGGGGGVGAFDPAAVVSRPFERPQA